MRLAWLTDIHLNFLPPRRTEAFLQSVAAVEVDAVLISGDIAEAHDLPAYLEQIDDILARPVYFVLGNHDFYHGSIAAVRETVREICQRRPNLHYLSQQEQPVSLSADVALVGHDGWADGRLGNYETSLVQMSDWRLIEELMDLGKAERWLRLQALADEAAAHLRQLLARALEAHSLTLVLTHVPPLREACWHRGMLSDDQWAPHFSCKAIGDTLLDLAQIFPHRQIDVYCGHTHGHGKCRPLRNLHIFTGGADYGEPHIQRILEV